MNVKISPELWNTLSPVQKRALADSLETRHALLGSDPAEAGAWAATLAAAAVVAAFAILLF